MENLGMHPLIFGIVCLQHDLLFQVESCARSRMAVRLRDEVTGGFLLLILSSLQCLESI